uniref:Uncharacterized protein n=1 Tax=Methylophaga nitratireducenticrescens TaxID=754476 RepID=I1XMA1_METNJ
MDDGFTVTIAGTSISGFSISIAQKHRVDAGSTVDRDALYAIKIPSGTAVGTGYDAVDA